MPDAARHIYPYRDILSHYAGSYDVPARLTFRRALNIVFTYIYIFIYLYILNDV